MVLEKTLESPLDGKEIQPVHPKGDHSWVNSLTLNKWSDPSVLPYVSCVILLTYWPSQGWVKSDKSQMSFVWQQPKKEQIGFHQEVGEPVPSISPGFHPQPRHQVPPQGECEGYSPQHPSPSSRDTPR